MSSPARLIRPWGYMEWRDLPAVGQHKQRRTQHNVETPMVPGDGPGQIQLAHVRSAYCTMV